MNLTTAPLSDRYDVIVVGARAAGASTAMLLAQRGLSVLAIDRGAYGTDTLSTHSLAAAGVLQLSRWGLLDTIRAADTPVTRRVVFRYGSDEVALDLAPHGDVDGLYSPRRTLLDRTLVDAAAAAGADVRHGTSLVQVVSAPDGRVVGAEIDIGGSRHLVHAELIVGADGARSRVARQVGAEMRKHEQVGAAFIFGYFEGLDRHVIANFYARDWGIGVIPTNDGLACVWAAMPPARFEQEARGRLPEAHAEQVTRVAEIAAIHGTAPVGGYRSFPGTPGFLRQAWGAGWALVGDAGYFKDPVSAHGITDAFIGAELLANATSAMLNDGVPESEAMGAYADRRDALAAEMMPPVARIASFPGDMTVVKDGFKEMSRAMRNEVAFIAAEFGLLTPA